MPGQKNRGANPRRARSQNDWQLQDVKARFSEVFRLARAQGPQRVTRRGGEAVVVLSAEDYERLAARQQRGSLIDFFATSPLAGSGINLDRSPDYGRPVEL